MWQTQNKFKPLYLGVDLVYFSSLEVHRPCCPMCVTSTMIPREQRLNIWFLTFLCKHWIICYFAPRTLTPTLINKYFIYLFSEYISRVVNTQNRRRFALQTLLLIVTGGFLQTHFLYRTDSEWRTSRTRVLNKTIKISELDTKQQIKQHQAAL